MWQTSKTQPPKLKNHFQLLAFWSFFTDLFHIYLKSTYSQFPHAFFLLFRKSYSVAIVLLGNFLVFSLRRKKTINNKAPKPHLPPSQNIRLWIVKCNYRSIIISTDIVIGKLEVNKLDAEKVCPLTDSQSHHRQIWSKDMCWKC